MAWIVPIPPPLAMPSPAGRSATEIRADTNGRRASSQSPRPPRPSASGSSEASPQPSRTGRRRCSGGSATSRSPTCSLLAARHRSSGGSWSWRFPACRKTSPPSLGRWRWPPTRSPATACCCQCRIQAPGEQGAAQGAAVKGSLPAASRQPEATKRSARDSVGNRR